MNIIYPNKHNTAISYQKVVLLIIPVVSCVAQASQVSAQIVPTTIQGTSTEVDAVGMQYDISGGQTSRGGENLFHAFEQFDLDTGKTANFVTNAGTQNIIGSVTGGNPSTVNGTLQVSGSDADLYLMNPAGILFGPQVQLNLRGGITGTTANGIDFATERFIAGESADYDSFVGTPTSLIFTEATAGAVVNLGDLQVDSGQSISLVGGTVVSTGNLEAPDGTVAVAAVEGENLVRLSQEGHLLSLEVVADETAAGSSLGISPVGISKMLTGQGFNGADTLLTDGDGTVRLGITGDVVSERGGSATLLGRLSTAGEFGGAVSVLGKQLSFETADETANINASGNIRDGLIRIDTENVVITDAAAFTNSEATTYLSRGYVRKLSEQGDVDIAASNDFTVNSLSEHLIFERGTSVTLTADSDLDSEGEFTTLNLDNWIDSDRGNISISGAGVTTGVITADTGRGNSGDIRVRSSRDINVRSISTNAFSSGNGGDVEVEAEDGNITIGGIVKTWASSNGDNNAGRGGQVSLISLTGDVTVKGDILSGSYGNNNNAQSGGNVVIEAARSINVTGTINTSSTAFNPNTEDAGIVELTAGNDVFVRAIRADSSGKGQDGEILLTGDRIDLLGGSNSVSGQSILFQPASVEENVNVGTSINSANALDISTTDLAAIKSVERISIGRPDSTGRVSLFPEEMTAASRALPIYVTGGETLVRSNVGSTWTIDGFNKGWVDDFFFENINSLEGGAGEDSFTFKDDGFLSGSAVGGDGIDTIDFTNSKVASAGINFFDIERVIGELKEAEPAVAEIQEVSELYSSLIYREGGIENTTKNNFSLLSALSNNTQQILTSAISDAGETSDSTSIEADMTRSLPATEALAIADTFNQIEIGIGANFRDYLNASEEIGKVETIDGVQARLRSVDETTGVTPSLVYVYFVPDAESESAVVVGGDRTPQDDDQLEVMLITQDGEPSRRRQWGITREQVEAASREMREQVTSQFSTARQYLTPAQQLYDWIVKPVAQDLKAQDVESLGFVMDDGLRMLPIAALHDGDRYLVEDYSVGLLPSFSLTEFERVGTESVDLASARVLAMGASEFENQPNLPAVGAEIDLITQQLWQGDAFLNEDFVMENLQSQIQKQDYGIIHLATHASFESGNLEDSYIQMWDDKLSLSDMESLGLGNSKVGLIILSACNTALGDRASEYGFAGFAVTAGSQSALASLWPVSDEGTLGFMSQFYGELRQSSVKAEALRQAQMSLISGEVGIHDGLVYGSDNKTITQLPSLTESGRWDFSHPFYWSAFTMIGNPW